MDRSYTTTELVDRVLELCDRPEVSAREVARKLEVSPSSITNWRRGTSMDLDWPLICRLSDLLEAPLTDIVSWHFGYEVTDEVVSQAMLEAISEPVEEVATVGASGPYRRLASAVFDAEQLDLLADNVLELDAHGEVIDAADRFRQAPPPEPEDGAAAAAVAA